MLTAPGKKCFLAALVLLVVGSALLMLPPYSDYCDIASNQDQYRCAPYEVTAAFLTFLEKHNALIAAVATAFIAWFTLTLKRSTDRLWDAGERQLKAISDNAEQQSRDMQASTSAAFESAEIARRASRMAQQNAEQQLRAYVFVENVFYKRPNDVVGRYEITFRIKNFGLTPAHNVRVLKIARVVDWNDGNPTIPPPDDEDSLGSMAPNQDFVDLDGGELTFDPRRLHEEKRAAYLVGTITYRTVFNGNARTHFRYYIGGDIAERLDYNGGEMYSDGHGNDAT